MSHFNWSRTHGIAFAQQMLEEGCQTACIAVCGYSSHEIRVWAERVGLPVLSGGVSLEDQRLVVSDLEQTKGFEFDLVWVANASADVLPHPYSLEDEQHRDLARLYVVLTRARRELYVSYSGVVSRFFAFDKCADVFAADDLRRYALERVDLQPTRPRAIAPETQVRQAAGAWEKMTGEAFLHSRYAIGISVDLARKIRELVDGKGLRRGTEWKKWRTMGDACADLSRQRIQSRRTWGPEMSVQLEELASLLSAGDSS